MLRRLLEALIPSILCSPMSGLLLEEALTSIAPRLAAEASDLVTAAATATANEEIESVA